MHSFKVPTMQPFDIAKQVVFTKDSTLAVGESDNGHVHVFLDWPRSGLVQVWAPFG